MCYILFIVLISKFFTAFYEFTITNTKGGSQNQNYFITIVDQHYFF